MIRESAAKTSSGFFMMALLPLLLILDVWWLIASASHGAVWPTLAAGLGVAIIAILFGGFFIVEPNQSAVLMLFGNYMGSERRPGLWWANPFMNKKKVTLRVRNFESSKLKVNDHDGNPIEIAAVVVWRVVDSAEAIFQVDNYDNFLHVQSEAAVRNLAVSLPYDAHNDGQWSLRGNAVEVAEQLKTEIQARLEKAGIEVLESRISHLAFA